MNGMRFSRMEWLNNFDIVDRKDHPEFIHYILARIERDKEPRLEEDDNEISTTMHVRRQQSLKTKKTKI